MADEHAPPEFNADLAKDLTDLKHWADALSRSAGNYRQADAVTALEQLQSRAQAAVAKIGGDMPEDVTLWARGIERDAAKALAAARHGNGPQDKVNLDELTKRLEQIASNADYAANGLRSIPPLPESPPPGGHIVDDVDPTPEVPPPAPPSVSSQPGGVDPPSLGDRETIEEMIMGLGVRPDPSPAPSAVPASAALAQEPLDHNPNWPLDAFGELERAASDPDYGIPPNLRLPWSAEPETAHPPGDAAEGAEPMGHIEHLQDAIRSFDNGYIEDTFGVTPSTASPSAPSPQASPAPMAHPTVEGMEQSVVPTVLPDPDMDAVIAEAPYQDPGIWNPDPSLEPEMPHDPTGGDLA